MAQSAHVAGRNREALLLRRRLLRAATEWDSNNRDAGFLYRGARLAETQEWCAANPGEHLTPVERDFRRKQCCSSTRTRSRIRSGTTGRTVGSGTAQCQTPASAAQRACRRRCSDDHCRCLGAYRANSSEPSQNTAFWHGNRPKVKPCRRRFNRQPKPASRNR